MYTELGNVTILKMLAFYLCISVHVTEVIGRLDSTGEML